MTRLVTALAAAVLAALALVPSAAAEGFGAVPGSTIAKAHAPCPLLVMPPSSAPWHERDADLECIRDAVPVSQAGAHPDGTGGGVLKTDVLGVPIDNTRDFVVETPPGFLGNPTLFPPCSRVAFIAATTGAPPEDRCQPASQVGVITVDAQGEDESFATYPLYRLTATPGYPASFGFVAAGFIPIVINANVRTDEDYGLEVGTADITSQYTVRSTSATLWGVPADPARNPDRWDPFLPGFGGNWGGTAARPPQPFIQTPADCSNDRLITTARIRSWQGEELPEHPLDPTYAIPAPKPTGCELLFFDPSVALVPSASNSDSPTGVSVQLDIPQNEEPDGLSTPPLKKAVVTLPEGMSVNPAAADGVEGCTSEQIGLLTTHGAYPTPIRFAKGEPSCPQASKVGRLTVRTALLEEELPGDVYLAMPYDNPFESLLAIYLVIRGPGFTVKAAGEVVPDPVTGQLTTTFDYSPQLPFDELDLDFFGGPRAPLATSPLCGEQKTSTTLTAWSRSTVDGEGEVMPGTPDATPSRSYEAAQGPAGVPCSFSAASRPFAPGMAAGTDSPIAGGHSALTMRLTRADGHQPLAGLTVKPPLGFTAKLAGIPYCSEQAIALATARTGKWQAAHPDCPAASRLGTVFTGAGAGPTPLFTPGTAYLAGPYKGAPLSMVIVAPAVAGGTPGNEVFDLGTVVVRVALHVDPVTAQVTAISDPVPQSLEGIPLRIRDIRVNMDRPEWGINPTSCAEKSFGVDATGQNGATASLSNRFQVLECRALGFEPPVALRLKGGTRRGDHPRLRAVVTPRPGDANIARAAVTLPRSAFLDQGHIRTVCTRVQFAAEQCPQGAVYGRAVAHTPLLDQPLRGPVYLRSSNNLLPDLVAHLKGPAGQPIEVELSGRTDSVRGALRNTFDVVPDAQVSRFVLTLQGGKKGLIVNSRNLCAGPNRANARYVAHNGRRYSYRPLVRNDCGKAKRRAKRSVHRRAR